MELGENNYRSSSLKPQDSAISKHQHLRIDSISVSLLGSLFRSCQNTLKCLMGRLSHEFTIFPEEFNMSRFPPSYAPLANSQERMQQGTEKGAVLTSQASTHYNMYNMILYTGSGAIKSQGLLLSSQCHRRSLVPPPGGASPRPPPGLTAL